MGADPVAPGAVDGRELTPRELGRRALRDRIRAMGIPTGPFEGPLQRDHPDAVLFSFLNLTRVEIGRITDEQFKQVKDIVAPCVRPDSRAAHDALTLDGARAAVALYHAEQASVWETQSVDDWWSEAAARYHNARSAASHRRDARRALGPSRVARRTPSVCRRPRPREFRPRRQRVSRGPRKARAPDDPDPEPEPVVAVALVGVTA